MKFTYESGTVTSPCSNTINFVRVKDVLDVIKRTVTQLQKTNRHVCLSNFPPETLWLHVSCDKGEKSTKLILQIINSKDHHSIQYTKLLGLFEGRDSIYNIEHVFSPIFTALHAASLETEKLNLQTPCDDLLRVPCQPPPMYYMFFSRRYVFCFLLLLILLALAWQNTFVPGFLGQKKRKPNLFYGRDRPIFFTWGDFF